MIDYVIRDFTNAVGTEYITFIFAFFMVVLVVYIFIHRFR